jgi:hypothetical protein
MTPAKIKEHEPTAVSRDFSDQEIVESGQTGTNTEEAREAYRRKGMTKVSEEDSGSKISANGGGRDEYEGGGRH